MTRPPVIRALVALVVLALSGFFVATEQPRLGLDLRGGTSITLQAEDSPTQKADAQATDRALEVLRRRVDALGVSEPTLARSGENRIIVELPGVQNAAEAAAAIGKTAQLTFHPVITQVAPPTQPQILPSGPPGSPVPDGPAVAPVPQTSAPADAPAPAPTSTTNNRVVPQGLDAQAAPPAAATAPSPAAVPPAAATPVPPAAATPAPVVTPVPATGDTPARPFDPTKEQTLRDDNGAPIVIGPAALTGEGVGDASVQVNPQSGARSVVVDFKGDGGRKWEALTAAAACNPDGDPKRRVAIVLDSQIISSPQVDPSVQCNVGIQGGSTNITGQFTQAEADNLAVLIKGGALPVPVKVISRSQVGPTLGQDAIDASFKAGIIGVSLTMLFLIFVYRFVGFLASVALLSYGLISYGALIALGATLTLPGLAGLLLSVGLAIDANVLVFERAKEEYAASRGKRLLPALDNGFAKAFSAIADSNVTTILAAVLLFLLASGTVRGFGVTLVIGVLASIISALVVTRVLTEFALQRGWIQAHPGFTGLSTLGKVRPWLERKKPDLMKYRNTYLWLTAALLIVAVLGMVVRGFNFGVEFTGGRVIEFATSQDLSVAQARTQVENAGFPTAVVQESNQQDITVRTSNITDAEVTRIRNSLAQIGGTVTVNSDDIVGPTLGSELRRNAILALGAALLLQLAYLAVRFRPSFALSTVLAMLHDVLLVLGLFAWLGKPIDGLFLAATLTIIGVSVNDSVVTMDRIRETWAAHRTRPLSEIVNSAIIATAPRTFNTGVGAFFILAALTLLGGRSLTDFALALLVGLLIGLYSSSFVASPLLLVFERYSKTPPPMPKRKQGATSRRRPATSKRRPPVKRPVAVTRQGSSPA